jgi:membrane protease YdiL (CAAX protease family)
MLTHPLTILINFIKNPSDFSRDNTKVNINKHIFAYIFFGITTTILLNLFIFLITPSQATDIQSKIDISKTNDFITIAILAVLLAPFYEEFLFRGLVSRSRLAFKRVYLFFVVFALFALLTNVSFFSSLLFGIYKLIFICSIFAMSLIIAFFAPIEQFYKPKPFNFLVHFQAFLFAIVHINNSQYNSSQALFIIPFLIINQLYLGYVHAYLASRFGIMRAIQSHFINNFIGVGFLAAGTLIENKILAITSGILALFLFTYCFYCFITLSIKSYADSKNKNFPITLDIN